jgi:hypothetical protein
VHYPVALVVVIRPRSAGYLEPWQFLRLLALDLGLPVWPPRLDHLLVEYPDGGATHLYFACPFVSDDDKDEVAAFRGAVNERAHGFTASILSVSSETSARELLAGWRTAARPA